jgi:hypothetical protein
VQRTARGAGPLIRRLTALSWNKTNIPFRGCGGLGGAELSRAETASDVSLLRQVPGEQGCDTVYSGKHSAMFQSDLQPPSSG